MLVQQFADEPAFPISLNGWLAGGGGWAPAGLGPEEMDLFVKPRMVFLALTSKYDKAKLHTDLLHLSSPIE